MRSIGSRLQRLELQLTPSGSQPLVMMVEYVTVSGSRIMGWKDGKGFYCARLPDESEEELAKRAREPAVVSIPVQPGCAIALYSEDEKLTE